MNNLTPQYKTFKQKDINLELSAMTCNNKNLIENKKTKREGTGNSQKITSNGYFERSGIIYKKCDYQSTDNGFMNTDREKYVDERNEKREFSTPLSYRNVLQTKYIKRYLKYSNTNNNCSSIGNNRSVFIQPRIQEIDYKINNSSLGEMGESFKETKRRNEKCYNNLCEYEISITAKILSEYLRSSLRLSDPPKGDTKRNTSPEDRFLDNKEFAPETNQSIEPNKYVEERQPRLNAVPMELLYGSNCPFISEYPSIYVSQTGLINIFLKRDIRLEMTVDRTLRLVNRSGNMAIATTSRGNACGIHHPSVKICQDETITDIDLFGKWRARIRPDHVLVGDLHRSYWFDHRDIGATEYSDSPFPNLSTDNTVNLLYSSSTYGPWIVPRCMELVAAARYERTQSGGVVVHVNNVKVIQSCSGDVIILSGPRIVKMRLNPNSLDMHTVLTNISVTPKWKVKCRVRKSHSFTGSDRGLTISNGKVEANLHEIGFVHFVKLPERIPIDL